MVQRFPKVNEEEIKQIVDDGIPKKTKESNAYSVKVFEGNSMMEITYNCKPQQCVSVIHVPMN